MAAAAGGTLLVYRVLIARDGSLTDVVDLQVLLVTTATSAVVAAAAVSAWASRRWVKIAVLIPAIAIAALVGIVTLLWPGLPLLISSLLGVGALAA